MPQPLELVFSALSSKRQGSEAIEQISRAFSMLNNSDCLR